MKCQMNSNCCAESKNSEIPTDQIEQNKKQSKKKKRIVSAQDQLQTIFRISTNNQAATYIKEMWIA